MWGPGQGCEEKQGSRRGETFKFNEGTGLVSTRPWATPLHQGGVNTGLHDSLALGACQEGMPASLAELYADPQDGGGGAG